MASAKYDSNDGRLRGRKAQARRLRLWSKNPCCARCGKLTQWPDGFEADHIVALAHGGDDDESNMQVLCAGPTGCHAKKSLAEGHHDQAVSFFPDWLEPSIASLTVIFGPPGSGKSTLVRERANAQDIVIDLDEVISDLSGQPLYHAGNEWLRRGVHMRNRMLASLSRAAGLSAWFITTGTGQADRDWWIRKLVPTEAIVLNTSSEECKRRIYADPRRPVHVVQRQIVAVTDWWKAEQGGVVTTGRKQTTGLDGWPI
jgi:5-methylcytosine-specific restriction protein A